MRLADNFFIWSGYCGAGAGYSSAQTLPVEMRIQPTASNITSFSRTGASFAEENIECYPLKKQSVYFSCLCSTTANSAFFYAGADLDAEL